MLTKSNCNSLAMNSIKTMKVLSAIPVLCLGLSGMQNVKAQNQQQCMTFETTPAQDLVQNVLKDPLANMEFRNIHASAHGCWKSFTNGHGMGTHEVTNSYLLPNEGVIMSTGTPEDFCGSDSSTHTYQWGVGGDLDLTSMVETNHAEEMAQMAPPGAALIDDFGSQTTYDACEIEFEFRCADGSPGISLEYVFGSEEYYENIGGSDYHDAFALFLNGENIALLPDGETMVTMNNVNQAYNSEFFVDNWAGTDEGAMAPYPMIEADGFTTKLTSMGTLNTDASQWNRLKMVIADKADNILDSYLLLRKSSFTCVVGSRSGTRGGGMRGASAAGRDEPRTESESTARPPPAYTKPAPVAAEDPVVGRSGGDIVLDVFVPDVVPSVVRPLPEPSPGRGGVDVLPEIAVMPMAGTHGDDKWYPNFYDTDHPYTCVFGSGYMDWMQLHDLNMQYLFDSEGDCCEVHFCDGRP